MNPHPEEERRPEPEPERERRPEQKRKPEQKPEQQQAREARPDVPDVPPVRVEVTGDLDLHTFRPRDLPELLPAWFEECRALGIPVVRVIHGKGTGTLRTGVHRLLTAMAAEPDPLVRSWTFPAPESAGGWGATLAHLR